MLHDAIGGLPCTLRIAFYLMTANAKPRRGEINADPQCEGVYVVGSCCCWRLAAGDETATDFQE